MITVIVIISLAILVLLHEFGHFITAKLFKMPVDEFGIGFPPRLFGKKLGKTLYSVNALPFGGFVKIYGETGEREKERENETGFNDQKAWRRIVVVLAGILMNFVLGWIVLSIVLMIGAPSHLVIAGVVPGSPAAAAGLSTGDAILRAENGGQTLSDPINVNTFVDLVKTNPDKNVTLEIGRGSATLNITIEKRIPAPQNQGELGVSLADTGFPAEPFFAALWDGLRETGSIIVLTFAGLYGLIVGLFTSGGAALQGVAGPVGIVFLASQVTSLGAVYLLQLMALISVNLAVLNLLPFPALDGGRALFIIIEKIKGSPVPRQLENWVNGIGFAALIILMVFITFHDLNHFLNWSI
ncbi:RIP metalloprotease RseP [Patescibacteria group bacterium]|nr:RIP metalloprotease RseP [Patescibacteria group bacterium]